MTAPTINGAKYPQPVSELLPAARKLATDLGETPSRNRLMKEFRIGVPKATELRERLIAGTAIPAALDPAPPVADTFDYAEPIGPDPAPTPDDTAHGQPVPPQRGWFRHRPRVETPPQVRVDGHPGTPAAAEPTSADRTSLVRIRWGVRLVLALGVAASIAGNVLHARDELISQIISAWSPLALLLTIELISRVPVHSRRLAVGRWAATALIAGIAAWVSYWHMAAVAARYGETNGSQYLLPLSVDGLVVVASICLVELGGRIAAAKGR
ncbi:DUF2637 domain-containing protein [Micromonospora sp. WMMA1363]|uniref:DUF2637 domain-containing protein n=1 Tax=Micromonospora sp. WMMA1363 TaxID=3053985 RepID=UPI00259CBBFB|nr:DUF2637 domain-containing protein [Micromonospora sp. WMMA1363]MDM4720867.1 DUF2637 domain-containing protein [Micromonospora sp. WMMA1363]